MRVDEDRSRLESAKVRVTSWINLSTFTEEANSEFKTSIHEYIDVLFDFSVRTANNSGGDKVQGTDVKHVKNFLYKSPKSTKSSFIDFIKKEALIPAGIASFTISVSLAAEVVMNIIALPTLSYIWIPIGFFVFGCIFLIAGMFFKFKSD